MENTKNQFSDAALEQILKETDQRLIQTKNALMAHASAQPNKESYESLVDFCYEGVKNYLSDPEHLKEALSTPKSIEGAYQSLVEDPKFLALDVKDMRHFPRVILMTILAGALANAALSAGFLTEDNEERSNLNVLADIYEKYMRDALSYGRGEDKNLNVTGNVEA